MEGTGGVSNKNPEREELEEEGGLRGNERNELENAAYR
jgi:hypothetical protein